MKNKKGEIHKTRPTQEQLIKEREKTRYKKVISRNILNKNLSIPIPHTGTGHGS